MELLIFKTNIQTEGNLKAVEKLFVAQKAIADWSVDIEDVDKVMRVELAGLLSENEVIRLIKNIGLSCEVLMYMKYCFFIRYPELTVRYAHENWIR